MNDKLTDAAVVHPADDLLGVAPKARILAAQLADVQPPFTVGIYGEWGSGKTSFASFVASYLEEMVPRRADGSSAVLFIPFSAWPYKDADEVLRALILTIARRLLGIIDPADERLEHPAPVLGLADRLKRFLARDALVIRHESRDRAAEERYAELQAKLDETLYGGIGKGSPSSRLNGTEAGIAVAKGVVAAMAGVSPVISTLRALLGLETQLDLAKLFDKEQNESTRQRIKSMEAFRRLLKELFLDELDGRRVFVFVDDLDRCMPDAALDLLEAIKIFLSEDAPCVFLVAADETVIGQGLRMRLRDLPESPSDGDAQQFLTKKGRQYFEKIIQLQVYVPNPGADEIQRFIGAVFPEWAPAGDLIETIIGTNPRRVKQYCNRLHHHRMLCAPTTAPSLLEELVVIRSKDEALFQSVCDLARGRDGSFRTVIAELEQWARHPEIQPKSPDACRLVKKIESSAAIMRVLREPPDISQLDADEVLLAAQFADIRPDPTLMFHTDDALFTRLLKETKTAHFDEPAMQDEQLIRRDFAQLAVLELHFPEVAARMAELARTGGWAACMRWVESTHLKDAAVQEVPAGAEPILQAIAAHPVSPAGVNFSELLTVEPLFSSICPEEVIAYHRIHPELGDPHQRIDKTMNPNPSAAELGGVLAGPALEALTPDENESIRKQFRVRREVIRDLVSLRVLVKQYALIHEWPKQYEQWIRDYKEFEQIEKVIQSPLEATQQDRDRLKPLVDDKRFTRLIEARPFFREMPIRGRRDFHHEPFVAPSPALGGAPVAPSIAAESAAAPVIALETLEYEDVYISLESMAEPDNYIVKLTIGGLSHVAASGELAWSQIRQSVQSLQLYRDVSTVSRVRALAPEPTDLSSQLKTLGILVYDSLFRGAVKDAFLNALASDRNLRIHWEGDPQNPLSTVLPWECLYVPPAPVSFIALTRKYSLTRRNTGAIERRVRPISTLRILVVSASPRGLPPLPGIEQEHFTINQVAERSRGKVELVSLQHATLSRVTQTLRDFRPHLVHFSGHGVYDVGDRTGELIFEADTGGGVRVPAEKFAILLHDYDVALAVLNGCDTGVSSTNDAVSSVAGALVKAGLPAVVATMRQVTDMAAILFTREFYSSFLGGFAVEGAIAEARKALSLEGLDWAAYALFVGATDLDSLRVMTMRAEKT